MAMLWLVQSRRHHHARSHHVPSGRVIRRDIYGMAEETYCAATTNDQSARVPRSPKLLKKIWAIGWPIGLLNKYSISVPMENARAILMAEVQDK